MAVPVRTMAALLVAVAPPGLAQPLQGRASPGPVDGATPAGTDDDMIIVTAVPRDQGRLDSGVAVTALDPARIAMSAPRSTAEIFRALPGIRSESSGGEGNANIAVRGLPLASGGSKYLLLLEDGMPVLQFGDIAFATADIFLRADINLRRIEAVRGGSAATFVSNSPGGVINLLSKTGETAGGTIQIASGLDHEDYRIDADHGGSLGDGWTYHVGGFYRRGEGPRQTGYDAYRGGQLKANVTRSFSSGFVRLYAKYLNDRAPSYLPSPVRVTGTNADPRYVSLPGYPVRTGSFYARDQRDHLTLGADNRPVVDDFRDGMHPVVKQVGLEAQLKPGAGWTVIERFSHADISGRFIAPFPALVANAGRVAAIFGGPGATLSYASGQQAGTVVDAPSSLGGNGLLGLIVVFDTRLKRLDTTANDLRVIRDIDLGGGQLTLTGGLYLARQALDLDWLWTSMFSEVRGDGRAALIDVRDAAGGLQTDRGVFGYGATFFGNCCRRRYAVDYTMAAPFGAVSYAFDGWTIDASLRWDNGRVRGSLAGTDLGIGGPAASTVDVDGDGRISLPETRTTATPTVTAPVRYSYAYLSWSVGVNYRLAAPASVFARYSRGGRANADRILFGPALRSSDGGLTDRGAAVDSVRQAEAGINYRGGGAAVSLSAFHALTGERNFEATNQRFLDRRYRAYGLELETRFRVGGFTVNGTGTWTHARIISDRISPANEGNRPRRQAAFVYSISPSYEQGPFAFGAQLIGTTSSYAQDNAGLKLPAYRQVNGFVSVRPADRLTLSLNANNLFDVTGFTEAEEGGIPPNGIVRARSINGRTVQVTARIDL